MRLDIWLLKKRNVLRQATFDVEGKKTSALSGWGRPLPLPGQCLCHSSQAQQLQILQLLTFIDEASIILSSVCSVNNNIFARPACLSSLPTRIDWSGMTGSIRIMDAEFEYDKGRTSVRSPGPFPPLVPAQEEASRRHGEGGPDPGGRHHPAGPPGGEREAGPGSEVCGGVLRPPVTSGGLC